MPLVAPIPDFDAVILAGGAAARMGGTDKPGLEVGGQSLLVTVVRAAAAAGSGRLIVVGPERGGAVGRALIAAAASAPGGVTTVRESPAGGGPVPALRRGLAEARATWVAALAADLPFITGRWLSALLSAAQSARGSGAVLADDGGRPQWLAGCWHVPSLRAALADYQGESLGGVLRPLRPALLGPGTTEFATVLAELGSAARLPWLDCDDPAQLAAARAIADLGTGSQ